MELSEIVCGSGSSELGHKYPKSVFKKLQNRISKEKTEMKKSLYYALRMKKRTVSPGRSGCAKR